MTSVEVAAALAVVSLMVGAAARSWSAEVDRVRVMEAQSQVLEAYRTAQTAARTRGRPAVLLVTPTRIEVASVGVSDTTVVLVRPGPAALGVTLSPARHVAVFQAYGMAAGAANVTHAFARGGVTRQLVVSRLGRVRVN